MSVESGKSLADTWRRRGNVESWGSGGWVCRNGLFTGKKGGKTKEESQRNGLLYIVYVSLLVGTSGNF